MTSFWKSLKKPFTVLAPMDDVTDIVFRQVVGWCARPDVYFTEFVNVEGLCSEGRERLIHKLKINPDEHPIVAQIWGTEPENYRTVARDIADMGFDGVDINMGCPVKDVTSHGCGAAMIKTPDKAGDIIRAVQEGVQGSKRPIAVSVKTRIGYKSIQTEEWIGFLLSLKLDALTVHGRTASEMSKVPAHWDEIGTAVQLRNTIAPDTVIIGNGDIGSMAEIQEKYEKYEIDGVMVGRGIFNDLFVFAKDGHPPFDIATRLNLMERHIDLFEKTWGNTRSFVILRKFFKIYISGFEGASEAREAIMETKTPEEASKVLDAIRHSIHAS